jgi:hypothetical protein
MIIEYPLCSGTVLAHYAKNVVYIDMILSVLKCHGDAGKQAVVTWVGACRKNILIHTLPRLRRG